MNLLEFLSFLIPYIFAIAFISPLSKGVNKTASESGIGIAAIATALKVKVAMAVCANDLFLFNLNTSISFFAACIPSGISSYVISISSVIPSCATNCSSSISYIIATTGIIPFRFLVFFCFSNTSLTICIFLSRSGFEYDFVITTIIGTDG